MAKLLASNLMKFVYLLIIPVGYLFFLANIYYGVQVSSTHLEAPFDLGQETFFIANTRNFGATTNPYSKQAMIEPPFNILAYTPLYFSFANQFGETKDNPFFMGRLLAGFFMVLAVVAALICSRSLFALIAAALTGLYILGLATISSTTFYNRIDSMALFLSVLGVAILARFGATLRTVSIASFLFSLSILTKQSYLAAYLSLLFFALKNRCVLPRIVTAASILLTPVFASLWLVICVLVWGVSFLESVFRAPAIFDFSTYFGIVQSFFRESSATATYVAFAISFIYLVRLKEQNGRSLKMGIESIYFIFSLVTLVAFLGKSGASVNYFYESTFAGLIVLSTLYNKIAHHSKRNPAITCLFIVLATSRIADHTIGHNLTYALTTPAEVKKVTALFEQTRLEISELKLRGSKVFFYGFSDHNPSVTLGFSPILTDWYVYMDFFRTNRLSFEIITQPIERAEFDLIATPRTLGPIFDRPEFYLALKSSYRLAREGVVFNYYLPRTD